MEASAWNPEPGNFLRSSSKRPGPGEVFGCEPDLFLRSVGGRETFVLETAELGPVVVKRQWGWVFADIVHDVLRLRRPLSPGRREFESLVALRAAGLRVPRAIAWFERSSGRRSAVLMEWVEHNGDLRERLSTAKSVERRALEKDLLGVVLALHLCGFHHRDLYLQHFLMEPREPAAPAATGGASPGTGLCLIDVERVRLGGRERWRVKDLAALVHSTPACVGPRERLRFVAGYLDGRGILGRAARRHYVGRVLRKAARIAAHRPRDERG